jgi:hypothetical protein
MKGRQEISARLQKFAQNFPKHIGNALMKDARENDVPEAKERAPVYSGPQTSSSPVPFVLQKSIHVEGPKFEGNVISVEVVAGGLAAAYAIRQHEDLTYHHKVGQAKYIESVIMESRAGRAERISKNIDFSKV